MTVDDLVHLIDRLVAGGATIEWATRQAEQMSQDDPELVRQALDRLDRERRAIRELLDPLVVEDTGIIEPWYAGPSDDDIFWPGLREALLRNNLPESALENSIDPASSKIVSYVKPPGEPRIDSRGLVVGHVQSGKTTSFESVIAKAADKGYRLFIVLSGIHDSLRTQTQERLKRDLISPCEHRWFNLTHDGDFGNPGNANTYLLDTNKRSIAVVKKNPARLKRLLKWLAQASDDTLRSCPIMVVDDEADQASIDVGRQRRSTINQRIIDILDHPKAAYIAYTATPFANLLIDPDSGNLYPRDFIVDLPKPEGHFGTEIIFGRDQLSEDEEPVDGLNLVRHIRDDEAVALRPPRNREEREAWIPPMTSSLEAAIRYFLLATAARRSRGQFDHSSMLVHTSVYVDAQNNMREPVETFLRETQHNVRSGRGLDDLREQWEKEQAELPTEEVAHLLPAGASLEAVSFESLRLHLPDVCDRARVVIDNSRSQQRLVYGDEPEVVIAIGGNTLSRGLTLEGLVVSYFLRAASTYDTLLQMGRWFGYRRGYEDLPRLWVTPDLHEWFIHLATVEEEIRTDIRRFEAEHKTPTDLAVRIRTHPAMAVTARAKMTTAVRTKISYSGERLQTFIFNHRDVAELETNLAVSRTLISSAIEAGSAPVKRSGRREGWWLLPAVSNDLVKDFLGTYRFHDHHADLKATPLTRYIDAQARRDALRGWNVMVAGRKHPANGQIDIGLPETVNRLVRSKLNIAGLPHANIKALVSKVDRVADLPEHDEIAQAKSNEELQRLRPSDAGLLILYPIDPRSEPARIRTAATNPRVALDAAADVIGVALVFPTADDDPTPQEYVAAFAAPDDLEDAEQEITAALDELDERDEQELRESGISDND